MVCYGRHVHRRRAYLFAARYLVVFVYTLLSSDELDFIIASVCTGQA